MPQKEIIFIPDEFMAKNLMPLTKKRLIPWHGQCIVHNQFTPESIKEIRQRFPHVKILAHPECTPEVAQLVDLLGGTEKMLQYVKESSAGQFMLITECGITDRIHAEVPEKKVVGTCALCPYMKQIMIKDVLEALKNPHPDQIVELDETVMYKANQSLKKMFELEQKN